MIHRQWLRRMTVVLLLATVGLSGCGKLNTLLGRATPIPLGAILRIGLIGPMPGLGDFEGGYTGNAALLAIEQVKASGGIPWAGKRYQLSIVHGAGVDADNQMRGLVFATLAPIAIIGPDESGPAVAALPIAQSAHIPQLTIATDTTLTDPTKNQNDTTIFRMRPSDLAQARAVTTYAVRSLDARSITVATIDSDYGRFGATTIAQEIASLGGAVPTQTTMSPGTGDVSKAVQAVMANHSDTVICWSPDFEASLLAHTLHAAGWHGNFVVGVADADFIALAGSDGDGAIGAISWTPTAPSVLSQTFVAQYTKRFGNTPDEHAAATYDAVQLIISAIENVGPAPDAINHYLAHLSNQAGVQGMYDARAGATLGAQGDLIATPLLVSIRGGKVTILTTS